eukprot:10498997-Prorocentrum_lima.AAC.1
MCIRDRPPPPPPLTVHPNTPHHECATPTHIYQIHGAADLPTSPIQIYRFQTPDPSITCHPNNEPGHPSMPPPGHA